MVDNLYDVEMLQYLVAKEKMGMVFYFELEEMFPNVSNSSVIIWEFKRMGGFSYYKQFNGGFGFKVDLEQAKKILRK